MIIEKLFIKMFNSVYGNYLEIDTKRIYAQFNHYKDFYSYDDFLKYYQSTPPHEIIEEIKHFMVRIYLPF